MVQLNISIVLYRTEFSNIIKVIESIFNSKLSIRLFLIDNSSSYNSALNDLADTYPIDYIFTGKNLGFGKAHNIGLRRTIKENVKYHLVLNPDVYFEKGVLEELFDFMERNQEVGLIMPKVLYPNGNLQYLCKLLPHPLDLFGRRFLNWGPLKNWVEKRNKIYELRFTGYKDIMEVPYLSGCFMFLRSKVLKKIGLFDERFFMYLEDTDLSRRIFRVAKNVFYPYVHIYHEHEKGSYKNFKLLNIHMKSAISYFNKWGWMHDPEREKINSLVLKKLGYFGDEK